MSVLDTLQSERQRLLDWKAKQLAIHEKNLQAAGDHVAARKAALAAELDHLSKWHDERTAAHDAGIKTVNDHVDREVAALDQQIAAERLAGEKKTAA
jgi:hypothetical protein